MYLKILYLALFLLIACQKKAAAPAQAPNFANAAQINTAINESGDLLTITVNLADGFHAYGPQEKIGKPVRLVVEQNNGWAALSAPLVPTGVVKKIAGLEDSYIISNSFNLNQKLKPGTGPGRAILYLQICTDSACDRPRTHEIQLEPPAK